VLRLEEGKAKQKSAERKKIGEEVRLVGEGFPVGRGEVDAPEVGGGMGEENADFSAVDLVVDMGDAAFLFVGGADAFHDDRLAGFDFHGELDEGAVGVDHQSVAGFGEETRFAGGDADFDGNVENDALAAASVDPAGRVDAFLFEHGGLLSWEND
jgi:hypothetical protein